jgi:hypothetical protein
MALILGIRDLNKSGDAAMVKAVALRKTTFIARRIRIERRVYDSESNRLDRAVTRLVLQDLVAL